MQIEYTARHNFKKPTTEVHLMVFTFGQEIPDLSSDPDFISEFDIESAMQVSLISITYPLMAYPV